MHRLSQAFLKDASAMHILNLLTYEGQLNLPNYY